MSIMSFRQYNACNMSRALLSHQCSGIISTVLATVRIVLRN